jgi:hypothetical protein
MGSAGQNAALGQWCSDLCSKDASTDLRIPPSLVTVLILIFRNKGQTAVGPSVPKLSNFHLQCGNVSERSSPRFIAFPYTQQPPCDSL